MRYRDEMTTKEFNSFKELLEYCKLYLEFFSQIQDENLEF